MKPKSPSVEKCNCGKTTGLCPVCDIDLLPEEIQVEKIIKLAKGVRLTKELYRLKREGKMPRIFVRQNKDGSLVQAVTMKVGSITYYFHNTNGAEVETFEKDDWKWTSYPLDGWEVSLEP